MSGKKERAGKKREKVKKSEDIFDKSQKVGFITPDGEWHVYKDEDPAEQVGFFPEWQYGKNPSSNTGGGMIEDGWYEEEDGEPPEPDLQLGLGENKNKR